MITFNRNLDGSWDVSRAKINRFGIGFGQQGDGGNKHYPTEQDARQAYERYLTKTRAIYAKSNGRDWTGQFIEDRIPANAFLVEGVKFVPLKKNGKRGVRIHTVYLYRMEIKPEMEQAIREAIREAFPHLTIG